MSLHCCQDFQRCIRVRDNLGHITHITAARDVITHSIRQVHSSCVSFPPSSDIKSAKLLESQKQKEVSGY